MKLRMSSLVVNSIKALTVLPLVLCSSYPVVAQTYTIPSFTSTNPIGDWSLGWKGAGQLTSTALNLFDIRGDDASGLTGWLSTDGASGIAVAVYNGTANPITLPSIGTWNPGVLSLHCGNGGQSSVVRFIAPQTGLYDIDVTFAQIDTSNVTGYVIAQGNQLFAGGVNGGSPSASASLNSVALNAGGFVDFAIDGQFFDSNTSVNPTLTLVTAPPSAVPEPSSVAFGVVAAGSILGLIARKRRKA